MIENLLKQLDSSPEEQILNSLQRIEKLLEQRNEP